MKVAVLADIHGNLSALEAVLADVRDSGASEIVVNGDMVNRGPQNTEVLELLAGTDAEMILGNHDDLLRMWVDRDGALPPDWFENPFWQGTAWCARQLERSGWIDFLRELPMSRRIALPGVPRVLVAHGSPRHYREGYGRHLTDEDIDTIGEEYGAELLIGSHTHIPLSRKHGRRLVLNSGAVGTPFNGDPRAQYLLLSLQDGAWVPEFRRVPYDRERTLEAFHSSGFLEEGGLSARIFYQELLLSRSFFTPFLDWAQSEGHALDETAWRRFRERFPDRFRTPGVSSAG